MKFRKKPVVIDAVQWFPGIPVEGVVEKDTGDAITEVLGIIRTLEGDMTVMPGDWIITGVKGEKYPCKPDIFAATYEPANSAAPPQCRFPWSHVWGKWDDLIISVTDYNVEPNVTTRVEGQERYCARCHKRQARKIFA